MSLIRKLLKHIHKKKEVKYKYIPIKDKYEKHEEDPKEISDNVDILYMNEEQSPT